MKKIVVIAGDKSGDIYGGMLCKALKEKFPGLEIFSFGGSNLAADSRQIINLLDHSVTGIIEIISSLKNLFRILMETTAEIKKIKPDLIIPVDFPDFNLRLLKNLDKQFPVFYYISPQIWAWRQGRIKQIKKYVDKMIVLFKFEEEFYKNHGVDVLYFGHPLLERIRRENIPSKRIISFLPGSRKNVIQKHMPVLQKTKLILEKELKDYAFRILKPENISKDFYKNFSIDVVPYSYTAVEESEFIVSSSGTATVEIAILEVPYLIIYKVHPLTWQILKKLVKVKFAGMINILSSQKIVEELLQQDATPEKIAKTVLNIIGNKEKYEKIKQDLRQAKNWLSPYQATEKFADYIGNYLNLL